LTGRRAPHNGARIPRDPRRRSHPQLPEPGNASSSYDGTRPQPERAGRETWLPQLTQLRNTIVHRRVETSHHLISRISSSRQRPARSGDANPVSARQGPAIHAAGHECRGGASFAQCRTPADPRRSLAITFFSISSRRKGRATPGSRHSSPSYVASCMTSCSVSAKRCQATTIVKADNTPYISPYTA
jgi:hypothetical protein